MKRHFAIALLAACLVLPARALMVGADIGYLTDAKDAYLAARIGAVFKTTDAISHVGELEVGYNSQSESGVDGTFLPVTVNYRAIVSGGKGVDYYFGGGLGEARVRVSGYGISDIDWAFATQAFAGVSLRISDQSSFDFGLRYIWIDDVKLLGTSIEVGDDLAIEGGLSFKF